MKFNDGKLHVVVCNVGQGDAIFITMPDQAQILIDGGPDGSVLDCLASNMPFWDRSLDMIMLTHPHADHLTGLIAVVERYSLDAFYTEEVPAQTDQYKLLKLRLADKNLSAKYLTDGDAITEKSGASIVTLWPRTETIQLTDHNYSDLDLNGLCLVQILKYGEFQMLLTGDAGAKILDQIAFEIGDIDVLKVPHHGSRTGMSEMFLDSSKPELAVISVGKDNHFGHPAKFSLDLLKNNKIKTLRTDENGEVEIISDGLRYLVIPYRNL